MMLGMLQDDGLVTVVFGAFFGSFEQKETQHLRMVADGYKEPFYIICNHR